MGGSAPERGPNAQQLTSSAALCSTGRNRTVQCSNAFEQFRALLGAFRAASGEARNCETVPESARY
eukprot:972640-Alexandrium_andersonii.AAC.1